MAYGPNIQAVMHQEGVIAARILLGANPAETPVETPTRFEFVLNLKTAKTYRNCYSTSDFASRRRGDRINWRCPLLAQSGHR